MIVVIHNSGQTATSTPRDGLSRFCNTVQSRLSIDRVDIRGFGMIESFHQVGEPEQRVGCPCLFALFAPARKLQRYTSASVSCQEKQSSKASTSLSGAAKAEWRKRVGGGREYYGLQITCRFFRTKRVRRLSNRNVVVRFSLFSLPIP